MILTVTLNPSVDRFYFVEKLNYGETNRVMHSMESAGGKGIQVAKVAHLLGQEVVATGFLGGGNGEFVNTFLERRGIQTSFLQDDDETRLCVHITESSTNKLTELLEPGDEINQKQQSEFITHFTKLLENCSLVAISGSVPAGVDETYYPKLINIAKKKGKRVILDTSGKLLKAGIDALPHIIKPNKSEMTELVGRELKTMDEVIDAAFEIKEKGLDTVIVSLGKDGAIFVAGKEVWHGTTPDIKVVNSVACGDSLVAGFATGLLRKLPIDDTIKLAMAVSTANALTKEDGYFIQDDLDRLLTQVDAVKLR